MYNEVFWRGKFFFQVVQLYSSLTMYIMLEENLVNIGL
jgi:hypothetical protein